MGNTIGFHGLKKRGHEGWGTGRKGRICSVRQEERGSVLEVIEEGKSWGEYTQYITWNLQRIKY